MGLCIAAFKTFVSNKRTEILTVSASEMDCILRTWKDFAQKKVFSFRGVTPAAYEIFSVDYFNSIVDRSKVHVMRDERDGIIAVIVYEQMHEAVIVHWAWTHFGWRNKGLQYKLWGECGINRESNVFITHLTVVSEKLAEKYGWLYNPFPLYKGKNDETCEENQTH